MSKWLLAMLLSLWMVSNATAQNETVSVQSVVEKVAPSIATVKVVLKTTMRMGGESMEEESKMSLQGVVVTPDGLIMVSNSPFSPKRMMEILAGEAMPAGMDYKMTPTSIKVIFGNEDKEYDAFLAATDAKLDLAFIKVEGLGDRQLTRWTSAVLQRRSWGSRSSRFRASPKVMTTRPTLRSGRFVEKSQAAPRLDVAG
jgi:S1-C subfamily serine protease